MKRDATSPLFDLIVALSQLEHGERQAFWRGVLWTFAVDYTVEWISMRVVSPVYGKSRAIWVFFCGQRISCRLANGTVFGSLGL